MANVLVLNLELCSAVLDNSLYIGRLSVTPGITVYKMLQKTVYYSTGMLVEIARDHRYVTGNDLRPQACYRRWSETTGLLYKMIIDHRHATGDGQRPHPCYRRLAMTADMMWLETEHMLQETGNMLQKTARDY